MMLEQEHVLQVFSDLNKTGFEDLNIARKHIRLLHAFDVELVAVDLLVLNAHLVVVAQETQSRIPL